MALMPWVLNNTAMSRLLFTILPETHWRRREEVMEHWFRAMIGWFGDRPINTLVVNPSNISVVHKL